MEESLNVPDFNPKKWLTANLELASHESLDVQLSEVNFNLGLFKSQLEESIQNSQFLIQTRAETIESDLMSVSQEYAILQQNLDTQVQAQNSLGNLKLNEALFSEISEISLIKTRLNDTLQMMDLIMSLDFHLEELTVFLEENNLKDIQKKVDTLAELFKLLRKLPFLDSRREKYECLIQRLKDFLCQMLTEKLSENDKMPICLCQVFKISRDLSLEYLFLEYYSSMRLNRIVKNFMEACKAENNENLDFLEGFCETLKREIEYFGELLNNKLGELMSEVIREAAVRLLKHLIEEYYSKSFNQKDYQPKILTFIHSYLKICKFLANQIETGVVSVKSDVLIIENTCFSVFNQVHNNFLIEEAKFLTKVLLKKVRKTEKIEEKQEKNHENWNFEERIADFSLLKLPETIETSFRRVQEVLFGTELDEWILGLQKVIEEIFQKMGRLFDEVEFKNFQHPILDSILVFGKNQTKKNDILTENIDKRYQVNENLSLIELLLDKYEELSFLEETMSRIDKQIRVSILENETINFPDIFLKIQKFLLENSQNAKNKRKNLILSLKTGLVIFEGLFNGVGQCKGKIKRILMKIFLCESFEKVIEITKMKIWKESENKSNVITFQKITEQVSGICQNFFLHIQIFEEIKKGLERNSVVSSFLDNSDSGNKGDGLNELYRDKLKYESYLFESDSFENTENRKNCRDMVEFWGTIYAHFLIKMFCFCLKSINELGSAGRKQLKMDVEYLINVLQEYLSQGSKGILEELMGFLKINENKKVVYLRGVSHSDLNFI